METYRAVKFDVGKTSPLVAGIIDLDASDPDPLFRSAGKGSITARVQTLREGSLIPRPGNETKLAKLNSAYS